MASAAPARASMMIRLHDDGLVDAIFRVNAGRRGRRNIMRRRDCLTRVSVKYAQHLARPGEQLVRHPNCANLALWNRFHIVCSGALR